MLKFTADHEWVRLEGDIATIGITTFAQEQLGDVVFVELPVAGKQLVKGAAAAVVESVKAASEVYAPVGGEVVEINQELVAEPGLINSEPMGRGWFFKIRIATPSALDGMMDEATYNAQRA